jgi:glycosyltransferase involved in cell wall biosynthesis
MFIFSEDPPLKYKGHGLSVLLYNLFYNSGVEIEKWFTFLSSGNIYADDILIDSDINFKILDTTPIFGFLRKSSKVNLFYNQLLFLLFLPSIIITLRKQPTKPVFIPIGASAHILYKICVLKLFTINPIWIYVVDDLNEISARQNQSLNKILCNLFLKKTFKVSQRIYAITDRLATIIGETSGKEVDVILPCFQKVDAIKKELSIRTNRKFTFVFTGGLNFLYNDSLKQFSDFLNRLEEESTEQFLLIIQTYSSREEFNKIGFTGSNVEYRTSENRSDLYKTYQEADAFIVPYSFDQENYTMISTSFPQKIAQIIQLGIPIVVFGPPYGSVVDFFKKKEIDYIIDQNDYRLFKSVTLKLLYRNADPTDTFRYLEVYESSFSQKACLSQLLKI